MRQAQQCPPQAPALHLPPVSTWADRSATGEIHSAKRDTCFISVVTHGNSHRFSVRVHWGVKMAALPFAGKGTERWQGHSRSIGVLRLHCADGKPWSRKQPRGSITCIHFPIHSSGISEARKALCLQYQPLCLLVKNSEPLAGFRLKISIKYILNYLIWQIAVKPVASTELSDSHLFFHSDASNASPNWWSLLSMRKC